MSAPDFVIATLTLWAAILAPPRPAGWVRLVALALAGLATFLVVVRLLTWLIPWLVKVLKERPRN